VLMTMRSIIAVIAAGIALFSTLAYAEPPPYRIGVLIPPWRPHRWKKDYGRDCANLATSKAKT
jgi:hypothetical protein